MGGYGSGRKATRPGAEASRRFPVEYAARALAAVRRADPAEGVPQATGAITWSRRGKDDGSAAYTVVERTPGAPVAILRYALNGAEVRDLLDLVERPSNLPGNPGRLLYFRCPCGQLARVLYLGPAGRFRCRRCVPVVYESSRDSDARVSRILAGILDDLTPDAEALQMPLGRLGAAQVAQMGRANFSGLMLALKALDKLGQGIGPGRKRPPDYWHGGAGRPWSPARRAAQRAR